MYEEKYRWIDPDPNSTGVLLSDRIKFYVEKVNLIEPIDFVESNLGAASYILRVGDEYYLDDELQKPDDKGQIKIPKNGLVYLKIKEKLSLPYYIIAQHDLKVKQVYRGFLAGRSSHIDPGYSGNINYPVFNFTSQVKILKVGQPIISIIFIKTTPFGTKNFWENNMSKIEEASLDIEGIEGKKCIKYKCEKDRTIQEYWYGGDTHISSVRELSVEVKGVRETVKFYKYVSVIGGFAFLLALITFIWNFFSWHSTNINSMKDKIYELTVATKQLENGLKEIGRKNLPENKKSVEKDYTGSTNINENLVNEKGTLMPKEITKETKTDESKIKK